MNTKQPEALRLAKWLDAMPSSGYALTNQAASELRRLYEENQKLREANEVFGKRQDWWCDRMWALVHQRDELLEALKLASVVINDTAYGAPVFRQEVRDVLVVIDEALAEQPAQKQEPDTKDVVINNMGRPFTVKAYVTPQPAQQQEPVANELKLHIIRKWPEGFQERLQHVWLDVVSFIPDVKLYDLQRVLAEFGFTMKVYEGDPPASKPWVGLTDEEYKEAEKAVWAVIAFDDTEKKANREFYEAIEAKLREKNA